MIDVSLLLLRSFLCGVVISRTSKSEKKSLFGEKSKNLKSHFFFKHTTSLYDTIRNSLSSFGQKTVCLGFFVSSFFLGGVKKNSKNRKRGEFFCSRTLSLSLCFNIIIFIIIIITTRTLLQIIQRKRGSKTTPQHQNTTISISISTTTTTLLIE